MKWAVSMVTCTSCNRDIPSGEVATKMPCPSCGEQEIVRCRKCKRLSRKYACPKCGFVGP
ncbi:MAG: zinc finger domain-containing protein [Candidatus Hadarchaeales archaeon]